ncbi:MAG TPA: SDR family oxidoreductase [Burkholderiales bacterium]|nr:SDR family oxidoreductase [Burkholderiales bacterium]
MRPLAGRVAIVTGAARGIGLTYALRLAALGANTAITDIDLKSAAQYKREADRLVDGSVEATLRNQDVDVLLGEFNAADAEANAAFARRVYDQWGRIDILVANAGGGSNSAGSFASELNDASVRSTFERNFFATVATCTAVAPYMKKQRSGKIINIASMAGAAALSGRAADYASAKAAVAHYTRMLAQDLAPFGINVNAIAPGYIASGQWQARFAHDDPQELEQWAAKVPMGRLGTPEDCADVIQFLSTSLSDYVTGQVIAVDGGMTRGPN